MVLQQRRMASEQVHRHLSLDVCMDAVEIKHIFNVVKIIQRKWPCPIWLQYLNKLNHRTQLINYIVQYCISSLLTQVRFLPGICIVAIFRNQCVVAFFKKSVENSWLAPTLLSGPNRSLSNWIVVGVRERQQSELFFVKTSSFFSDLVSFTINQLLPSRQPSSNKMRISGAGCIN